MEIKAAFPRWPWSDLVDALEPNGRFLDTQIAAPEQSREPIGVEIQSYVTGLFAEGTAGGYVAPPGADEEADLTKWFALLNAGEPFPLEAEAIENQIYDYHDGYSIPLDGKPAPMLLESGWTDDLFPPEQSLRVYNQVRAAKGYAALMFGDLGHSRATTSRTPTTPSTKRAPRSSRARLQHSGRRRSNGSVTAYTQTCPTEAAAEGPVHGQELGEAPDRRGHVRLRCAADVHLRGRQPGDRRRPSTRSPGRAKRARP